MDSAPRLNRRQAFTLIGLTAAGGAMISRSALAQSSPDAARTNALLMPGADVCLITPEVTEGPYYFDPALERADITEGRPGVATRVRLQIVDQNCDALSGARVDLWHADATGVYSGYAGQGETGTTEGETFMRGTQFADAEGIVEFVTVWPGWYRGRTTHMHFKVLVDEAGVLTGQIFFPDALSQYIYLNVPPYNERAAERDTLNADDGIAAQATRASYAFIKELADSYLAAMIIGVDPVADSSGFDLGGGQGGERPEPPAGGMPPQEIPTSADGVTATDRAALVPGQ